MRLASTAQQSSGWRLGLSMRSDAESNVEVLTIAPKRRFHIRMRSKLDGIRVLDLSRVIAGPLTAQILADLGATVIKVEQLGKGDEARSYGTLHVDGVHVSALFASLNRNKRSIALDLRRGLPVFRRLVRSADVLVHNFRPGVSERLCLDYARLRRVNPRLVYCAISGFGEVGPLRAKAGNDLIAQAYSGLMSFSGEPNGAPIRCPVSIADFSTGLYGVIGILGALFERDHSGHGQEVRTSLLASMLSLIDHHLTESILSGRPPQKMGSANLLGQPNQAFQTRDGWVVISAVSDRMWERCCNALRLDGLKADSHFASLAGRYQNREELISTVSRQVECLTTEECVSRLDGYGVTCSPLNGLPQLAADPQVSSLDLLMNVEYLDRTVPVVGSPLEFDGQRPELRLPPPALGEHTDEVLTELGYRTSSIHRLRRFGVVA